jgi:hypothetical protein
VINALRYLGQFAIIVVLFAGVIKLSDWPVYRQIPKDAGILMLTFVHGADRKAECRPMTAEESAKLPPNMRRVDVCPRSRRPIFVELDIAGKNVFSASLPPSGIARDGPSKVYERFTLPAGEYDVAVRMRDTPRAEGFDYERRERISIAPDQMLVIDYRSEDGGFIFR